MSIEQTQPSSRLYYGVRDTWASVAGRPITLAFRVVVLFVLLVLLGGSALPAEQALYREFAVTAAGRGFNLVEWEAEALWRKLQAQVQQPGAEYDAHAGVELVEEYLERAGRIGELESLLVQRSTLGLGLDSAEAQQYLEELGELRIQQAEVRPSVEQVLEGQIGRILLAEGFGLAGWPVPPVQFTFTEPPKKMVVSPRDRIATIYSRMLDASLGLSEIEAAEAAVAQQPNASAYIAEIGGLGAYPTMVVDRANLEWVLSTIAHEWVHNYLVFFPLGWNYFRSQDLTTMNETVAEIVGNEIGEKAYARYYAEPTQAPATPNSVLPEEFAEPEPPRFDFRREMRETRLEVDRLLAAGEIEEAEAYMERRRQEFVEHGFPIRVLNQAFFAFHGSYGTGPASTSPIGPKLERLRELMPDLETFLTTVRWFTSPEDLDESLAKWEQSTPR